MTFNFETTTENSNWLDSLTEIGTQVYNSTPVDWIKYFLIVYTLVLLADVILLLILRGVGTDFRVGMLGADVPTTSRSKMKKRFDKIKKRLETQDMSQHKIAVIEADSMVDNLLSRVGYSGENMTERLGRLGVGQLDYQEDLLKAHQIRNQVIRQHDFNLDEKTAKETIDVYEKFLRYLEFI